MMFAQARVLRGELHGRLEGRATLDAVLRMTRGRGGAGRGRVRRLGRCSTRRSGRSIAAQIVSVGTGLVVGAAVYVAGVLALRVPEARQIERLVRARLAR